MCIHAAWLRFLLFITSPVSWIQNLCLMSVGRKDPDQIAWMSRLVSVFSSIHMPSNVVFPPQKVLSAFSCCNKDAVMSLKISVWRFALWVKTSADHILKYLSYNSHWTGLDIFCKLSPWETICMECQILFSGKNKKNISKCRLLKILPSMQSVRDMVIFLI